MVSRDRGGAHAGGAPQAIQIADRWHLAKNVGFDGIAYLVRKRVKILPPSQAQDEPRAPVVEEKPIEMKKTEVEQRMRAGREHKQEQHKCIHQLHQQGVSIHGIARHLGVARNTSFKD